MREAGEGAGLEPSFYFCGDGSSVVIDGKERRGIRNIPPSALAAVISGHGAWGKGRTENVPIEAYERKLGSDKEDELPLTSFLPN